MRVEIRYKKHFAYGENVTLHFDVDEDCLVSELKVMVH